MSAIPDVPLKAPVGWALFLAGAVLALTNFMVVLDTTIANVSVPHISGSLGVSVSQGTWVITSYSVAEAICVPLTGWLARRFGTVKLFITGVAGFGCFSFLCGNASSLELLVLYRVGQGLCGGPLMALSQTLLYRIFPPEKRAMTISVWAMTTVTAPILGPFLGGIISDGLTWNWIFFINLPIAVFSVTAAIRLLLPCETPTMRLPLDIGGLILMILAIGGLQIMLDIGRERDWFSDPLVTVLAVVSSISFVAFIIWEFTADHPVVDLRIFRYRGYSVGVFGIATCYGAFFSSSVILPQWLQGYLGYPSSVSGTVAAYTGMMAFMMSPVVGRLVPKIDLRFLAFGGIIWLFVTSLLRLRWTSGADYWTLSLPQMLQGFGIPFFFTPLNFMALSAVRPEETASAAGIMGFLRTLSGAVATSLVTTLWLDQAQIDRTDLVAGINHPQQTLNQLQGMGFSLEQGRGLINQLVENESVALGIQYVVLVGGAVFLLAACLVWLAPPSKRAAPSGADAAGH